MINIFNTKEPILRAHCETCEARYQEEEWVQIDKTNSTKSWNEHFDLYIRNDFYDDYLTYKWSHRIDLFKDFWRLSKEDYKTVNWFSIGLSKDQLTKIFNTLYNYCMEKNIFTEEDEEKVKEKIIFKHENDENHKYYIPTEDNDILIIEHNIKYNDFSFGVNPLECKNTQKDFKKYWRRQAFSQLKHPNHNYANKWFEMKKSHIINLLQILYNITEV